MSTEDILTAEQVAELLHCDVQTVEVRTRAHELPGVKFGRQWVYSRAALLEAITRRGMRHMEIPSHVDPAAKAPPAQALPMGRTPRPAPALTRAQALAASLPPPPLKA